MTAVRSVLVRSVLVRYFAAAAEAAGKDEESVPLPPAATIGQLKIVLAQRYGAPMATVLKSGSFLVDGVIARDELAKVGDQVDVLPPFSGG